MGRLCFWAILVWAVFAWAVLGWAVFVWDDLVSGPFSPESGIALVWWLYCINTTLPTADSWYRKPSPRLCPGLY